MDWGIIGIIISFALGSFMLVLAVLFIKKRRRFLKDSIETEAVIEAVEKTGYVHDKIIYKYTVAGNNYKGTDMALEYGYNAGDTVRIRYSQDNPVESIITRNIKGPSYTIPIGCLMFFALLSFAIGVVVLVLT